jgi:hypothetical protein
LRHFSSITLISSLLYSAIVRQFHVLNPQK